MMGQGGMMRQDGKAGGKGMMDCLMMGKGMMGKVLSFAKIPSGPDSHRKAESSHP